MKRVEGVVYDILVVRSDESAVCHLGVMSYNCCGAWMTVHRLLDAIVGYKT